MGTHEQTLKRAVFLLILAGFVLSGAGAKAAVPVAGTGLNLSALVKFVYTYRERNDLSGVKGVSAASLRWLELDLEGGRGEKVGYRLDLVGASGIYHDPITGQGAPAPAGPDDFGSMGVRRAEIDFNGLIPRTRITIGTFMPSWGVFQQRAADQWEFVDLPLIYTHPAFHAIGWQNTGIGLVATPLKQIELGLFMINGYFPNGLADNEPALPNGGADLEKGLGARLRIMLGPLRIFGGYYQEGWQQDLKGGPGTEEQHAVAWLAGAEFKSPEFWALFEWSDLMIEHYQLMQNGDWANLRSMGGHADLGWWMLDDWEALLRWEWIDPDTADTAKSFNRSRFDQLTQWSMGLNYRLAPGATFMADFVIPLEEGHKVDVAAGKVGGKYQVVENNYFRIQFQVRQ